MSERLPIKEASICYVVFNDEVLLIEKKKKFLKGQFVNPGGKMSIEDDGSWTRCAVREVREETGIELSRAIQIGEIFFDNSKRIFGDGLPGQEPDHRVYFFLGTGIRDKDSLKESDEGRPGWYPWDEFEKLKMSEGDRLFHKWFRESEGRYFIGTIRYDGRDLDSEGSKVEYFVNKPE